ncbi:Lrp/AsnC ligand binding domain-containing protein [Brevibacillus fortis]|nr:Lrp/AsnC ligand binding domain-containing protein [Brevibacillus fortis]
MAGAYDYVLKVAVKGTADLERFISETLKQVEGVSKTNTMIVLSSMKEEM